MPNNAAKQTTKAVRFALPAEHTPRRHDSPWSKNRELRDRRPDLTTATNPRRGSSTRQGLDLESTRAVHGSEKSSSVSKGQSNPPGRKKIARPEEHKPSTLDRKSAPNSSPPAPPSFSAKRSEKRPAPSPPPRAKTLRRKSTPRKPGPEQVRVNFHRGSRRTDVKIAGESGLPPLVVKFR